MIDNLYPYWPLQLLGMNANPPNDSVDVNTNQDNISVLVHPLVVLNVSEHWMRERLALDSTAVVVYGALLGKHRGREIEVCCFISLHYTIRYLIHMKFWLMKT